MAMITMTETPRSCPLYTANMQDHLSGSPVFAKQNRRRGDLQAAVADLEKSS